jgi:hypothetical protein
MHSADGQHTLQHGHVNSGDAPPQSDQNEKASFVSNAHTSLETDPVKLLFSMPIPAARVRISVARKNQEGKSDQWLVYRSRLGDKHVAWFRKQALTQFSKSAHLLWQFSRKLIAKGIELFQGNEVSNARRDASCQLV